jgi:hypothetical protein
MNAVHRLAQYIEWLQDIEPITAKGAVEQVRDSKIIKDPREVVGQGRCPQTTYPSGATA